MKKILITFMGLLFAICSITAQMDSLYLMKSGDKLAKYSSAEVDSIIFKPTANRATPAIIGFNEMFSLSHLFYIQPLNYSQYVSVMTNVPQNMPVMSVDNASNLLTNIELNGRQVDVFRDILSLKTIEPTEGAFPFDKEFFAVLQMYQQHNVELILAFGNPYPDWVAAKVKSLGGSKTVEMVVVASIISDFLTRQQKTYGLDPTWMVAKLKIEPFNEFNAGVSGNASDAVTLDNTVKMQLTSKGVLFKEVLASSIISGTNTQYLNWWTSYYQAGGNGTPNIHLFAMQNEGININQILLRWESVVATLQSPASLPNHNRIVIGEIGFPRAGLGNEGAAAIHSSFLASILSSNRLQSVDRILFWRIFSDWLYIDCTDGTCDPITAKETTFGFLNYRTNTLESQMLTRFFPAGFWWTHK